MLNWMGNKDFTVEIFYMPLFVIPVTDSLFLTPPFSKLYPPITLPIYTDPPLLSLNKDVQITLRHLVTSVHNLFATMDIKEDIYSLGDFSAIAAGMLDHLPAAVNRRKTATNKATLIIVDRSLDFCGAVTHNSDSLLDKIKLLLPKFPGHSTDIAVDMSSVCMANIKSVTEDIELAPGCLAHNYNINGKEMMQALIHNKQKDILNQLHISLSQIKFGQVVRSPPRITTQSIEKLLTSLKGEYEIIEENSSLIQQALAVVQTLKSPLTSRIELTMSLEQLILQNLAASRESTSVLTQLSQIIKSRRQRGLTLDEIFCLLVYVYSLAGCDIKFSDTQEKLLEGTLIQALTEDLELIKSSETDDPKEIAISVIEKLKSLTHVRNTLTKYKSVLHNQNAHQPAEYKGVIQQLVEDLINPAKPDIVDLASKSVRITDLLKSSLSLFMNKPKQQAHPIDNPQLIIFVIGGVTAQEAKLIESKVRNNTSGTEILIGSTQLITPLDAMHFVLDMSYN